MVPPKKDEDTVTRENLEVLCILMATALEFTPDFDAAAAAMNISQPRNVTRKVNFISEPIGYKMYRKNFARVSNDSDAAGPSKSAKKPVSKTKPQPNKPTKKSGKGKQISTESQDDPSSEDNEGDDQEETVGNEDHQAQDNYSPATNAIMEAMAGRDVTPGQDTSTDDEVTDDESEKREAAGK